ncbi:hypothetical protein RGQ29_015920 [Quercus rubra]|uniref:Aspartate/glutamate/uridylate kinase domain-containing protein n=1 Tax=Quercus rubra TaxID=3512 RepID=A0AAN7FQI2_QUERU|nr:hypothetical protein RGQ29_015920 [Quercus rubra]
MKGEKQEIHHTKPIRCIVKLGGAAITCKNELEKINEENLDIVSSQLRQAMMPGWSSSMKVLGMDWSKRHGESEVSGSFGHFQASKSGVHKGGLDQSLVKAGFVATRISVTTLNLEVVRALAREGIPSIGMSPFSCGWSTKEKNIASADLAVVDKAIDSGFIPTDVFGVYDRPPTEPNAVLLREIAVGKDGKWSVVKPELQNMDKQVQTTVAAHDTTGGMETKIAEAAMIARLGIDVYIVKAATNHALRALSGELRDNIPDDWSGTVIRFVS